MKGEWIFLNAKLCTTIIFSWQADLKNFIWQSCYVSLDSTTGWKDSFLLLYLIGVSGSDCESRVLLPTVWMGYLLEDWIKNIVTWQYFHLAIEFLNLRKWLGITIYYSYHQCLKELIALCYMGDGKKEELTGEAECQVTSMS